MIVVLFSIVGIGNSMNAKETESPDYLKYVDEIIDGFVKDMKKKYNLNCYGSGGSMPTDVEKVNVLFTFYRKSTVDDARKMEVNAVQDLLQRINTHAKIRPYLREYPFGTDRVGVTISFRTKTDGHPLDGSVALVFLVKNKICYHTAEMRMSDPINSISLDKNNKPITKIIPGELEEELVPLMEESYEEALKIVGILPSPNQKD